MNRRKFISLLVGLPFLPRSLLQNSEVEYWTAKLYEIGIDTYRHLCDPKNPLRRVGVSFTDEQKAQVQQMVKTNKIAEAQRLILDKLNEEFIWRISNE